MTERPEQLPELPDPRPPGECLACLLPIAVGEDYCAVRAAHTGDHGLLCASCWSEGRGALTVTAARKRERRLHTVPSPPQP
jgi:hypothetical protein